MHTYTFNGQEAVEPSYDGFFNEGADIVAKFADQQAAAGTSMSCKGADANTLYIYYSNGDDMQYNVHKYVMKNSKLELAGDWSDPVGQGSGNTVDI